MTVIPKSVVFKDINGNEVHRGNISEERTSSVVLFDTE
jgi:hypothetical protein